MCPAVNQASQFDFLVGFMAHEHITGYIASKIHLKVKIIWRIIIILSTLVGMWTFTTCKCHSCPVSDWDRPNKQGLQCSYSNPRTIPCSQSAKLGPTCGNSAITVFSGQAFVFKWCKFPAVQSLVCWRDLANCSNWQMFKCGKNIV